MSFVRNRKKHATGVLTAGLLFLYSASVFASPLELSVNESIAMALENNPAVKMSLSDRERTAWGVNEALAGKKLSLSLGSTYNIDQSSPQPANGTDFNNSLRLSWPLYTGGRIEGQIDRAGEELKMADLSVEKTKQQVRLDTVSAYYNVLQAKSMVNVNEESVKSLREHLKTVQAKYEAGVVAKSDVLRSEVELTNAEQTLLKSQNSFESALAGLKNVIGLDLNTEVALKDELNYEKTTKTLEQNLEQAQQNRPEIAQAQAGINAAKIGVQIAESGKLPSVSLGGSTQWGDSIIPDDDSNWSVNLSASWNIFDSGLTNSRIKQAKAAVEKAGEQARQTIDSIQLEVRQTYLSMREAEKRLETTQAAIAKAEEDLYIAQEKYRAGAGTNLDVIDARLALTQAKTNHIGALYDYNLSKAKLDKATGAPVQ